MDKTVERSRRRAALIAANAIKQIQIPRTRRSSGGLSGSHHLSKLLRTAKGPRRQSLRPNLREIATKTSASSSSLSKLYQIGEQVRDDEVPPDAVSIIVREKISLSHLKSSKILGRAVDRRQDPVLVKERIRKAMATKLAKRQRRMKKFGESKE